MTRPDPLTEAETRTVAREIAHRLVKKQRAMCERYGVTLEAALRERIASGCDLQRAARRLYVRRARRWGFWQRLWGRGKP